MDDGEHKRDCLARWMLNHWVTRAERRESMQRMYKNLRKANGKESADQFMADLRRRMKVEWSKRKEVRCAD